MIFDEENRIEEEDETDQEIQNRKQSLIEQVLLQNKVQFDELTLVRWCNKTFMKDIKMHETVLKLFKASLLGEKTINLIFFNKID